MFCQDPASIHINELENVVLPAEGNFKYINTYIHTCIRIKKKIACQALVRKNNFFYFVK